MAHRPFLKILLTFLLLLTTHFAFPQQYPVQVTTTLIPPYSVYLSDYTATGSNNLQVLVNLLELDRPSLQIKFRITIEGAGITLRTRQSFTPRPSVIQGGVPQIFLGPDLYQYFNPDNLDFEGITRTWFKQLGRLPEGFYTLTIEVLEYNRNVRVSNQSMTNAWIVLNDPPLINTPFNGDKLVATDPQNIMFSWTPRHLASPNAAFSTEYEFTLIELYPGQSNPEIAIRSSNSIFKTTTNLTSLNYGILEPTLIPGKTYAFRVRAYDTSGRDLFKNQGLSETYVFQYGDACDPPDEIRAKALDPERARISWENFPNHSAMMIEFREQGSDQWFTQQTNSSYRILTSLAGNTTYEYQVTPQCGSVIGSKSPLYTFTTPEVDPSSFVCGAPVPEFDGSPVPLMKPLLPLDVIRVGDWTVYLVSVATNGDGTYAGAGYAAVPNFNLANVRVAFDRILVNQDYQVIAGDVKSVYSADSRFVLDLRPESEPEVIEEAIAEPEIAEGPQEDLVADELAHMVEADIGAVVFSGGLLQITDEEGNVIEDLDLDLPPEGEELTITDSNGDTWVVDSEGGVSGGPDAVEESAEPELTGLSTDPDMVVIHSISESFKPGTDRAEFTYSIKDSEELPYRKLEIFYIDEEENEEFITLYELQAGQEINFLDTRDEDKKGWSGKGDDLKYVKPGNYKFLITATRDEYFKNGYMEWETVEVLGDPDVSAALVYDYIVSDEDAWFRESEAPFKLITPDPKTDILPQGTQVAIQGILKDDKNNEVARVKYINEGEEITQYTSLNNLTQVKAFDKERKYKFLKDITPLTLPYGLSNGNSYEKDNEVTIDKYCGDYLKIKGGNGITGDWILKSDLLWVDLVPKDVALTKSDISTKIGTKYIKNETSPVCNVCVRSVLLLLKEDPALFPLEGSAYYDPGNSYQVTYPKGYITNPGKAKNIKLDMDNLAMKIRLNERFSEIEKKVNEGYEAYFKRLQDKADAGGIVIGTYISNDQTNGHVMMITPGGLVEITKETLTWGWTFDRKGRAIKKLPRVLECGTGARESEAPLCRNVDYNGATSSRIKWFLYY